MFEQGHIRYIEGMTDTLQKLWKRGASFLGSEHAILGGAMTWVSERNLVSALSNSGGFGVLACGSMPPERLEEEIIATRAMTDKPFGVNLILMHPKLDELCDVCVRLKVTHMVLAGGIPKGPTVEKLKSGGCKVIGFAPSAGIGKKLVKMGVDALVIEGSEAGGHIGPVSTSVLAQEILPVIREVPVFVAGGIGRGEQMATYLLMGAAGVQLGTRFVCAEESIAHVNFKKLFIRAAARDAMPSVQVDPDFPVIPVRAVMNRATEAFTRFQHEVIKEFRAGTIEKKEAQLKIEHFWAGALRKAVVDGDVENGSVMAGQSVGLVEKVQPMREIVQELVGEAEAFLNQQFSSIS